MSSSVLRNRISRAQLVKNNLIMIAFRSPPCRPLQPQFLPSVHSNVNPSIIEVTYFLELHYTSSSCQLQTYHENSMKVSENRNCSKDKSSPLYIPVGQRSYSSVTSFPSTSSEHVSSTSSNNNLNNLNKSKSSIEDRSVHFGVTPTRPTDSDDNNDEEDESDYLFARRKPNTNDRISTPFIRQVKKTNSEEAPSLSIETKNEIVSFSQRTLTTPPNPIRRRTLDGTKSLSKLKIDCSPFSHLTPEQSLLTPTLGSNGTSCPKTLSIQSPTKSIVNDENVHILTSSQNELDDDDTSTSNNTKKVATSLDNTCYSETSSVVIAENVVRVRENSGYDIFGDIYSPKSPHSSAGDRSENSDKTKGVSFSKLSEISPKSHRRKPNYSRPRRDLTPFSPRTPRPSADGNNRKGSNNLIDDDITMRRNALMERIRRQGKEQSSNLN